jgi:hypothetical protein
MELQNMKSLKLSAVTLLMLLVGCFSPVFAQSDRGSIRGTVTDPNGAIVPNARIVVTSLETGETRETTASEEGNYTFPELRAAVYEVSVEAAGFQKTTITDFKVAVQVNHTLNIELQVGVQTNEVTINADSEALNTETPVTQTNVTERQVKELPLLVTSEAGGRTPLAFIFLDSNVSSTGENGAASDRGTNASRFRVSGGQALGTEILIDGASTRRTQNGTFFSEVAPGPNAFQEFTISTSSYSAEFGNSSGGVVNFTLKSGTNDFHGEVYNLVRNEKFNANSFYNKLEGRPRDRDNQNNYGFNIGGPIPFLGFGEGGPVAKLYRNQAFFFFNYEGYRFRQGETVTVSVPTQRMRNGDFGELLTDPDVLRFFGGPVRIYNPRIPIGQRNTPYANNFVPIGDRDPAGQAILQFFPLPNRPGVFRNYVASSIRPTDMNQTTLKTDFILTSKQRLTFSWSRRDQERVANYGGGFPRFPYPFIAQDVGLQATKSNFVRAQHDYSITPNILNHFNFGFNYFEVQNGNSTYGFNTASLGIPTNATLNEAFPRINFPGYGDPVTSADPRAYQNIGSTFFNDDLADRTIEFSDFVTVIRGRHTFKVGASVRQSRYSIAQRIDPGGTFNFRHDQTSGNDPGNGQFDPRSGFPIASLITGATEFAFNFNNSIDPVFNQLTHSYFIQDDIKLTQKLTINVGLRYDLPNLRTEERDRFRTFDPNVTNPIVNRPGAIVSANGAGGLQAPRTLAPNDKSNIGPRLGISYAFNNKTVVRAGAGLYYNPVLYGVDGGNELNSGLDGYNTAGGPYRCDDPRAVPGNQSPGNTDCRNAKYYLSLFPSIPAANPTTQLIGGDPQFFDQNFKNGRTFQYSVDVQRELPYKFVASVGYIGHRADRLRSNFQRLNALPLNALRLGAAVLNTNINDVTAQQRAYAASIGINIPANAGAVFPGFNGTVAQSLRPFPQYNRIRTILESEGESDYNALQVKLERRFAQGIQFGAAYTLAKLVTNASEDLFGGGLQSGVLQNPFDISSLKTDSPTLPRHVFVTNFLVELPFGKGRKFLNQGGIVNALFGGFQVSGVFRYQTGTPLVVFLGGGNNTGFLDVAGYFGNLRLNLTGQPLTLDDRQQIAGQRGAIRILNPAAFAAPPSFNTNIPFLLNGQINPAYAQYYAEPTRFFGNAPAVLNDALTDPFRNEDISILKKTRITETTSLELGAEFFNVFNRLRYGLPGTDFNNQGEFGVIRVPGSFEVQNPRVIQFRARFIF